MQRKAKRSAKQSKATKNAPEGQRSASCSVAGGAEETAAIEQLRLKLRHVDTYGEPEREWVCTVAGKETGCVFFGCTFFRDTLFGEQGILPRNLAGKKVKQLRAKSKEYKIMFAGMKGLKIIKCTRYRSRFRKASKLWVPFLPCRVPGPSKTALFTGVHHTTSGTAFTPPKAPPVLRAPPS